jgi:hypothetical protein
LGGQCCDEMLTNRFLAPTAPKSPVGRDETTISEWFIEGGTQRCALSPLSNRRPSVDAACSGYHNADTVLTTVFAVEPMRAGHGGRMAGGIPGRSTSLLSEMVHVGRRRKQDARGKPAGGVQLTVSAAHEGSGIPGGPQRMHVTATQPVDREPKWAREQRGWQARDASCQVSGPSEEWGLAMMGCVT